MREHGAKDCGAAIVPVIRCKRHGYLANLTKASLVKLGIVLLAPSVALAGCGGASTSGQGTDKPSSDTAATEAKKSTPDGAASAKTPDPAFDKLLPKLQRMTTAPIMLPASLPSKIKSVGIEKPASKADPYVTEGDKYTIVLLYADTAPNHVIKPYIHVSAAGQMVAWPASDPPPPVPAGKPSQLGNVTLPDGTVANLKRLEPPQHANYGPFTVGTFETEGERYTVMIENDMPEGDMTRQILSTMVRVPRT
jgi:hypothetical protein